jgi:hypothetical protein
VAQGAGRGAGAEAVSDGLGWHLLIVAALAAALMGLVRAMPLG